MRIILIAIILFTLSSEFCLTQDGLVGTFYGGWGRRKGDYIWIKDYGKTAQFVTVGDVNGDGFEDAIAANNGTWEVALSDTYITMANKSIRHFAEKSEWISGFGATADKFMVGELNGDRMADIIAFNKNTGGWEFAFSDSTAFLKSDLRISDFGTNAAHQFMADINGDLKDDAITYESGTWHVCTNNGNGFDEPTVFITGFGDANSIPFIADVNKDKRYDAIILSEGKLFVSKSDGISFIKNSLPWKSQLTYDEIMFDDVNGDGLADLILYHAGEGQWEFCPSNGTNSFGAVVFWCFNHGNYNPRVSKGLPACHRFFTGYVQSPDGNDYGVSPIAVNLDVGYWQIMPPFNMFSNKNFKPGQAPNWYCNWHYSNRSVLPLIENEYYAYDAEEDDFAIDWLVSQLAGANIDYVLLDQSNPWEAVEIAHEAFAHAIQRWNSVPGNRKLKYAICGKFKYTYNSVEESAKRTFNEFYYTYGTENYQHLDGKPLLVCYGGNTEHPDSYLPKYLAWENYTGDKTYATKFTLKWMDGSLLKSELDESQWGNYYGWVLPEGTLENPVQMVVQPGYYNGNKIYSRSEGGIEGDRYRTLCWDKVLMQKPGIVSINSFHGDTEQCDIYTKIDGDFMFGLGKTESWSYPDMYWEMTKDYIQNYKSLKSGKIEHMAEYGTRALNNNFITVQFKQPFNAIPALFLTIKGAESNEQREFQVTEVTKGSFTVQFKNIKVYKDSLNWLAVIPGHWETTNGVKLAAGRLSVQDSCSSIFVEEGFFQSTPAFFSMNNTNRNKLPSVTLQSVKSPDEFSIQLRGPDQITLLDEVVGWIAIETDKREMWTGRFQNARILLSNETEISFNLSDYFYDEILTLAKSSSSFNNTTGDVIVKSTTNLGGTIRYQAGSLPDSDTLNIISFDGRGGCLYAAKKGSISGSVAPIYDKGFRIFPNPAMSFLNIEIKEKVNEGTIELLDLNSRILLKTRIHPGFQRIDISQLPVGQYLCRIFFQEGFQYMPLIKTTN